MRQKIATDTALTVAMAGLAIGWVVSMLRVVEQTVWVRSAQPLFFVITIFGLSAIAQVRADWRLDEVELAATRFGARWGLLAGVVFVIALTYLPPFQSLLAETAGAFGRNGYPRAVEARMFLLGIVGTFFAQEAFRCILTAGWKWSKP
jgi:hypothetical protein